MRRITKSIRRVSLVLVAVAIALILVSSGCEDMVLIVSYGLSGILLGSIGAFGAWLTEPRG